MSSAGSGALLGALYLASRKNVVGLLKTMVTASLAFGLSLIAFSFFVRPPAFVLFPFAVGMRNGDADGFQPKPILQTIVDEDKRGRYP